MAVPHLVEAVVGAEGVHSYDVEAAVESWNKSRSPGSGHKPVAEGTVRVNGRGEVVKVWKLNAGEFKRKRKTMGCHAYWITMGDEARLGAVRQCGPRPIRASRKAQEAMAGLSPEKAERTAT